VTLSHHSSEDTMELRLMLTLLSFIRGGEGAINLSLTLLIFRQKKRSIGPLSHFCS